MFITKQNSHGQKKHVYTKSQAYSNLSLTLRYLKRYKAERVKKNITDSNLQSCITKAAYQKKQKRSGYSLRKMKGCKMQNSTESER